MNWIKSALTQVQDSMVNNSKVAVAVPITTTSIGFLAEAQSWLTVLSMSIGVIVSALVMVHWWLKVKITGLEYKERLTEATKHGEFSESE